MTKRKQPQLAADYSDDDVVSEELGSIEKLGSYYKLHPIYKSTMHVDIFNIDKIPCRQRSMRGFRREKKTAVLNAGKLVGSVAKASRRSRDVTNKPKGEIEESDCVIVCTSVCNGRVSRRRCGSTTKGQENGKLGSQMFEIYIENMWRKLSEEEKNEYTYLDSLWFSLHAKGPHKSKVLSWIKRKDIFSKKYVFVPIVQWGHWFLLIFCHFGENSEAKSERRCMLLLDSLQNAHSKQLESGIRKFVFDIFETEERPENKELIRKLPLLSPKVPQQKNSEECGFFVLYYIYKFLKSACDHVSFSTGCTHFMKENWFTHEDVERFSKSLNPIICDV
ncbi:probable ubiquitin-like-specific protease 2A isoform X1 [Salvia splendens]|uniref:probable ubiquitin-like-specific protease 2A isoform X1 n=1 Tax=Salvia splendens TaxID=180675 RepID=UPI001C25DEBE|nr:probable ubiquitin-like-specific protease 2A isoform X1 [Salvia splendens]XP_042053109.1 probable ubiquitin-like-specific protease 2A isoform X1 [Salvia splendens]XP_042053110.1 probable ubiquitin-like-specific protease 2A isoform X1 [Salvia splendens]XP_042053111.1 probable ubiquitin-like-specific protease 2A isoform X1 [Salvia splendens]